MSEEENKEIYELKADDSEFKERSKSVFDQLGGLEDAHRSKRKAYEDEDDVIEEEKVDNDVEVLKVSRAVKTKSLHADHVVNPHKWKKYSLEDVDQGKMSTRANYDAAMEFINRNKCELVKEKVEDLSSLKPVFNRNIRKKEEIGDTLGTSSGAGAIVKDKCEYVYDDGEVVEDDDEDVRVYEEMDADKINFKMTKNRRNMMRKRDEDEVTDETESEDEDEAIIVEEIFNRPSSKDEGDEEDVDENENESEEDYIESDDEQQEDDNEVIQINNNQDDSDVQEIDDDEEDDDDDDDE